MRQVIIRVIRSASQIITLAFVQWVLPILDWIETLGVPVNHDGVAAGIQTVLFGLVVLALSEAEKRWPIVSRILSWNLAVDSGIDGYTPKRLAA